MKMASHFNLMVGVGLLKRWYLSRDENKEREWKCQALEEEHSRHR